MHARHSNRRTENAYCGGVKRIIMGRRMDHQYGTNYAPKGQPSPVPGTDPRFVRNSGSAITNCVQLSFMIFKNHLTESLMLTFLKRLVRHGEQNVYLILDRHPAHRSKRVRQWVENHPERIELFYLSGYSPQLNPAEYLNNHVKGNAVGRCRPNTQSEMMANVRSYLRSTQKRTDIVKSNFQHTDVLYAAE